MENKTVKDFFSPDEWEKTPPYEKARLNNKLSNYNEMTRLGFKMPQPDFVVAWLAKEKSTDIKPKEPKETPSTSKSAKKKLKLQSSTSSDNDTAIKNKPETVKRSDQLTDQQQKASDVLKLLAMTQNEEFHGFTPQDLARSRCVANRMRALKKDADKKYQAACKRVDDLTEELRQAEENYRIYLEEQAKKSEAKKSQLGKENEGQQGKEKPKEGLSKNKQRKAKQMLKKNNLAMLKKQEASQACQVVEEADSVDGNLSLSTEKPTLLKCYPLRERTKVNYQEAKLLDADDYLFCDACQHEYPGVCPQHGKLQFVTDRDLPKGYRQADRALKTLPRLLCVGESSIRGAGLGVWTHGVSVPKGVVFGPYQGKQIHVTSTKGASGYSWIIKRDNKVVGEMDGADPSRANWMRFINCTAYKCQQNLMSFQFQGMLYFRTVLDIPGHTELMVYYGDHYARLLGIDTRLFHSGQLALAAPTVFACSKCKLAFTSPIRRDRHESKSCRLRSFDQPIKTVLPYLEPMPKEVPAVFELSRELNEPGPEGKKRYKCGECSYSTDIRRSLNRHTVTHTGERKFACLECQYKATQKGDLKKHMLTHSGEKAFSCKQCDYQTARKGNLTRHMLIHTGVKPFQCKECDFKCNVSSNLTRHIQHKHSKERPLACQQCTYTCIQSNQLARHIKRKHNE